MPIEIKELIVRAVIREDAGTGRRADTQNNDDLKDEIIKESSEKVLHVLKNKKER